MYNNNTREIGREQRVGQGSHKWNSTLLPGTVAQWLERPPHEREVVGSNPGRVIPKTYNNGTFCLLARRSAY